MQKKLIAICVFVLLFSFFSSDASAETATTPSTLKQQMKDLQQERKDAMSQAKGEAQELKDQFKTRLQTIQDTRKRLVVEKLDLKIAQSNAKHTARFSELLTKLQIILDRISATSEPGVLPDINKAQNAINAAKDAVASQSAKIYAIQITTEANLRIDVGTIVSQFRKDLMTTHKLVIDAKQAVQNLQKNKIKTKNEATSSAGL